MKDFSPIDKTFLQTVKQAILQTMKWYSTMETNLPNVDQTLILVAVGLPDDISPPPESILDMIKCGCSGNSSKD